MHLFIKAAEMKQQLRETIDGDDKISNQDIDWSKHVLKIEDFDWNEIFETDKDKYNATLDFPACAFYQELMRYYAPNYKVILTVRDNEHIWFDSVKETIAVGETMMRDY